MKAAIFDLDGTLLDSMSVWQNILGELLTGKGVTPSPTLLDEIEQLTIPQKVAYVADHYALGATVSELLRELHGLILDKYRTAVKPKENIIPYLQKLRQNGIGTCVATLTDKRFVKAALEYHGMTELFDFVLTVEEVGKSKESPDIYLEAARKLGEDVADTVVFEDSLYAIKTAKAAGFTVYAVADEFSAPDKTEILYLSDRYIEDFEELI